MSDHDRQIDLERVADGDAAAWSDFVDAYAGLIYAAVHRALQRGGARDIDAEDCAQDVFIKLLDREGRLLRRFDEEKASLSTYLTLVARSVTIDRMRKRGRRRMASLEDVGGVVQRSDERELSDDGGSALERVPVEILTERQRLVMRLMFDEQRSVPEAAAMLGVSEQTIRSTRHKAISRLRAHFEAEKRAVTPDSGLELGFPADRDGDETATGDV